MKFPRLITACLLLALLPAARLLASSCTLSPAKPTAGQLVTLTYDKAGGPLAGSDNIRIHRGINGWGPVSGPDQTLTKDAKTGLYTVTYRVSEAAYQVDFAFNGVEMASTWDNNSGADWHFPVDAAPIPSELPAQAVLSNASKAHVMMQGFYWDVPIGSWYDNLTSKAAGLRNMRDGQGIDRIWFPSPAKADSGINSMGYDPYDYYDLGDYSQKGTTAVRFGTHAQLKTAIKTYHDLGVMVLADIIANHRGGGALETNPNTGTSTYTNFTGVASGKCTWTYQQFNPNSFEFSDDMNFSGFADVSLSIDTPDQVGWPRRDLIDWMVWLTDPANAGFDGWRLDLAQGYRPSWIRDLRQQTGNTFAVMEKWDGNTRNLTQNVVYSGGTHTFDFAAFYTMRNICVSSGSANLADLVNPDKVYAAKDSAHAVTFVENHDTAKDSNATYSTNKMLSYAFILTYEGYPCLFWKDYFDFGLKDLGGLTGNGIDALVWARGALAGGAPRIEVLKSDTRDLLIYGTKTGTRTAMGCLTGLSLNASSNQSATVTTSDPFLKGRTLHCYAWYSYVSGKNVQPADVTCDANGSVTLVVPPLGYAVYGPANLDPGPADTQPAFTTQPFSVTTSQNTTVTFTSEATGGSLAYQWYLNGSPINGANAATCVISAAKAVDQGTYTVKVSNSVGSITSAPATLTVGILPISGVGSRLVNISTRSLVGTDSNQQIAGFVITGTQPKKVLIRAAGPSLNTLFGITNALTDTVLTLKDKDNVTLLTNDDWPAALSSDFDAVGAWGWPAGSKDSAMVTTLQPGQYTAMVAGKTSTVGVALVEVFEEDDHSGPSRLANISTRSLVGTGSDNQIAGFVITGSTPKTVVIRASGPGLARFGVPGCIEDPTIALYTSGGIKFLENDNWDSSIASNFDAVGAWGFDSGSKDAALVTTLQPGGYTVMVANAKSTTGVALIEVFEQIGN
jgi:alpha-amylase